MESTEPGVRPLWGSHDGQQRAGERATALALPSLWKIVRADTRDPLYRLKTDVVEIIRAIQVVLHRGSLRAAEEQTGHNYETIAVWLERLGDHAEAITDLLAHDLHLSEVELDELWSFVGQKGGTNRRESIAILA